MSQSDTYQSNFYADVDGTDLTQHPKIFESYSGVAIKVSQSSDVLEENSRATEVASLLQHGDLPELEALIKAGINNGTITEGAVSVPRINGEQILDVTILPENGTENLIILARDRRPEQVLNEIVSSIRNELEPQKMLSVAAITTVRALGIEGCRIYRRTEQDKILIIADYGNSKGLNGLDAEIQSKIQYGEAISLEVGPWQILAAATRYRNNVNGAMAIWNSVKAVPWKNDIIKLLPQIANQLGVANEQVANHERILALSRTDSLTGLLNRRAFLEDELPRRISRLKHNGQSAALFYADLDNFKLVNDVHGHRVGDDAILKLRNLLMDLSRPGDVIARLGGDEFAMWLDGVTHGVAKNRAKKLIEKSLLMRALSGAEDKPLGVSVGIAMFDPGEPESLSDLIARADAAMYAIKKSGKSGFQMATR